MGLALLVCGALSLLPNQSDASAVRISTVRELAAAYDRVQPGMTRVSQLPALGFDIATANAQVLSYLGIMERFAGNSRSFDSLDAALRSCLEARDRCTAFVFKPGEQHEGGGVLSNLGFGPANAAGRAPEVTFLVQDGRVAYKAISGVPMALVVQQHRVPVADAAPMRRPAALPVAERSVY